MLPPYILYISEKSYDVYKDVVLLLSTQTMNTKLDGSAYTASDMYGWELQVTSGAGTDHKVYNLIDAVGLVRQITHTPDDPHNEGRPVVDRMTYKSGVNTASNMSISLQDDSNLLTLKS